MKRFMKKMLSVLVVVCIFITVLGGCGKNNENQSEGESVSENIFHQKKVYTCLDEIKNADANSHLFQIGDRIYDLEEMMGVGRFTKDWTCQFYSFHKIEGEDRQYLADFMTHTPATVGDNLFIEKLKFREQQYKSFDDIDNITLDSICYE